MTPRGFFSKGKTYIIYKGFKNKLKIMKFFTYIKESFGEMKHVKWPTRKETIVYTVAVIAIAILVAYYLGLWDIIFAKGLEQII